MPLPASYVDVRPDRDLIARSCVRSRVAQEPAPSCATKRNPHRDDAGATLAAVQCCPVESPPDSDAGWTAAPAVPRIEVTYTPERNAARPWLVRFTGPYMLESWCVTAADAGRVVARLARGLEP